MIENTSGHNIGNAINFLKSRGIIYQTANLEKYSQSDGENLAFYVGFDCTAKSLHIGNAISLRVAKILTSMTKLKPIILMGGATTLVGDPSGKNKTRPTIELSSAEQNLHAISLQIKQYLGEDVQIVNNSDWLSSLSISQFLSTVGISLSVNRMVNVETIATRLESGSSITLAEFCYMSLQAYDFLHLYKNFNCVIQIGGADQWSNIICGIDAVKRMCGAEAVAITVPLLTKFDGTKMGKTESGALWLDESMCDSFMFWQFFRNLDDKTAIDMAKKLTSIDLEEINSAQDEKNINQLKERVAIEILSEFRGGAAVEAVRKKINCKGDPDFTLTQQEISSGIKVLNVLMSILRDDLSSSKVKEIIRGGGLYINDKKITSVDLSIAECIDNDMVIINFGKKRKYIGHILSKD